MPSFAKCAALAAGLFAAATVASPHGHMARAIHQKKDNIVTDAVVDPENAIQGAVADAAPAVASAVAPVTYADDSSDDESSDATYTAPTGMFREGCLNGLNHKTGAIALDGGKGAYVVQVFNNNTESDVDIVVWSSTGQVGSWSALTINVTPANITTTVPAGGNVSISFNPELYTPENGFPGAQQSISGALCPMYNNTAPSSFGGCSNTWFEYTFVHDQPWSTMDVSRLTKMDGTDITAVSYPEKGAQQACVSDMETCVYTCPDGQNSCLVAASEKPCNGNTGCMGYGSNKGYTAVYIG